jgi:hypothetical protein
VLSGDGQFWVEMDMQKLADDRFRATATLGKRPQRAEATE